MTPDPTAAPPGGLRLSADAIRWLGGRPDGRGGYLLELWGVAVTFAPAGDKWGVVVGPLGRPEGAVRLATAATVGDVLAGAFHAGRHVGGEDVRRALREVIGAAGAAPGGGANPEGGGG